ncbi:TIGR02391 family protein [Curtobacterium sp. MCSS17_005]|uniref:TIGR02391 family protein n=1 Tax=Curtobacterium sp. MCSS17_005 TaxID=2175641 RepID=UPI000DA962E4|nr:TIGR02391 family protein [Curtobacterium sp. MCSS17_005]WIB34420.1 TIGR02391 family protein [Curtobacterium sp. MCSS17_005]
MPNSDTLTDTERTIELSVAGERLTLEALLDATASEAGMTLLAGLAQTPDQTTGSHNVVVHAWSAVTGAGVRGPRARELQTHIRRFVADGFGWAFARGLVGPVDGHPSQEWMITTDGIAVAASGSSSHIDATLQLHAQLHPVLNESARPNFERGDYATAVFAAMHQVEVAVRAAAGFGPDKYGVPMVRDAFKVDGPLADGGEVTSEQEAVANLFAGAIGAFKNPTSHRAVEFNSPIEAASIIHLADLLLRMVDRAKARRDGGATGA